MAYRGSLVAGVASIRPVKVRRSLRRTGLGEGWSVGKVNLSKSRSGRLKVPRAPDRLVVVAAAVAVGVAAADSEECSAARIAYKWW